jgi:hypothetical protein
MTATLELGDSVKRDDRASIPAEERDVVNLVVGPEGDIELVVLVHGVGRDAFDLPGSAGKVDQALVADDDLHVLDPLFAHLRLNGTR